MRDHAPKPSFSMSQEQSLLQKEYDGTQLVSTVDKNSVENFHQQSKNEINHDLSAESQGIENRVKGNITGTNKFIKGAQADVIDPERAKLQKNYDRQSTNVGVVTAIKGGLSAVKNAVDSPQNFVNEKVEDAKEAYQSIVHGEKVSPEYKNIPQMLQTSLKISTDSVDSSGGLTQKQSISHNENSGSTSQFTAPHDGSTESLFKHQESQAEAHTPQIIKIKEVSIKQDSESIEKLNVSKDLKLNRG